MVSITTQLIEWYSENKRNLPWRETKEPYSVWVSEVILQQTRVNQGLAYYYRFMKEFPDITSLAHTPIDKLLKLWQGLGYYSRARNMHQAAREIVTNYHGSFPRQYKDLIRLKGIGDYTASAIASISFGERTPVLDGNVFRVIARFYGVTESTETAKGKKKFKEILNHLIPEKYPGTFNQALMEFGAIHCTPRNPKCLECIFKSDCFAFNHDLIDQLPVKKQKIKQKHRYFNYLHVVYKEYTFIEQRTGNDIWRLLYQFPLIETNSEVSIDELEQTDRWKEIFNNLNPRIDLPFFGKIHILSHQKLYVRFYKIHIDKLNGFITAHLMKTHTDKIEEKGVPVIIEKYLNLKYT